MAKSLESILYLLISTFINLIIFTFLAYMLILKIDLKNITPPINLYLQTSQVEELKVSRERLIESRPKEGKLGGQKGKGLKESIPLVVDRKSGDVPVLSKKETEEDVSILSSIEEKVRGKREEQDVGRKEIGELSAVVSQGGVGFSGGGGRGIAYAPPMPKLFSEEPPSTVKVRVWVDKYGSITRVEIVQRSGVPEIDQKIVEFVRRIRFEPIREDVVQTGILTFRFR